MRKLRLEVCHPQPSNAAPSLFQRRCLRTALSQTAECFSSSVIPLLSLSHFTRWIWRSPQSKVRGQLSSLSTNLLSKQQLSNVLLFLAIVPAMTIRRLIFLIPKSNFPFHLHSRSSCAWLARRRRALPICCCQLSRRFRSLAR